jgi:hypothetical protein
VVPPGPKPARVTRTTARSPDSDWFNWLSYARLRGGGYAYQVDAAGGSQVIVFRA